MTRLLARTALVLAAAAPLAARAQATTTPSAASGASGSQAATTPPNIAGTWELNVAKSDFGPGGGPTQATLTLTQTGDRITTSQSARSAMGGTTNTMHHTVGGAATTDTISAAGQQLPFTSTTRWDGATLVIEGKVVVQGTDIPIVSRYSLSPDGKQLIVDQVVTTPVGEQRLHAVYDKKG